jgi:RNA recognition motif-containing protein
MSTKLYVSNLPPSATADVLIGRFCKFGDVISVVLDPIARANRRGAVVEMATSSAAQKAIAALNLSDFDGRLISVFLALSRVPQSSS